MPDVQRAAETPTQAGLELQDLCTFTSIAPTSPRWLLLLLLLYAPIGLCLCAMRVAAAVVLAVLLTLLPASIVEPAGTIGLWFLCACCGVVVRTRCTDGAPACTAAARLAAARVIVANHQSQIDSWPFRLLTPIAVVVRETYRGTSSLLPVAKLTAADGAVFDRFGSSVAINGTTIVAGAKGDGGTGLVGDGTGSAYVFRTSDGATYDEVAKLTASDAAASDSFGSSLAIAGDTIAIGASYDDDSTGAVYVFASTSPETASTNPETGALSDAATRAGPLLALLIVAATTVLAL